MRVFHILDCWRWWVAEVGPLLPRSSPLAEIGRYRAAELNFGSHGVALYRGVKPDRPLDDGHIVDSRTTVEGITGGLRPGEPVIVSFDTSRCFWHQWEIPGRARGKAEQLLAAELARITPFEPEEMVNGWCEVGVPVVGKRSFLVRQFAIRRDLFQHAKDLVHLAGAWLVGILIRDNNAPAFPLALDDQGQPLGRAASFRWTRRAAAASVITALAMTGLIASVFVHQQSIFADLDHAIDGYRDQARIVRDRLTSEQSHRSAIAALEKRKRGEVPLTALWEELARLIPDTAWLQALSLTGSKATVEGSAQEAEPLIAMLEDSPMISNVRFAAPVVTSPNEASVRFVIEFEVTAREDEGSP